MTPLGFAEKATLSPATGLPLASVTYAVTVVVVAPLAAIGFCEKLTATLAATPAPWLAPASGPMHNRAATRARSPATERLRARNGAPVTGWLLSRSRLTCPRARRRSPPSAARRSHCESTDLCGRGRRLLAGRCVAEPLLAVAGASRRPWRPGSARSHHSLPAPVGRRGAHGWPAPGAPMTVRCDEGRSGR